MKMQCAHTMHGVQLREPGNVALTLLPVPSAAAGEVVLRVLAAGLCQTDLHIRSASDSRGRHRGRRDAMAPWRARGRSSVLVVRRVQRMSRRPAERMPAHRRQAEPAADSRRDKKRRHGRIRERTG